MSIPRLRSQQAAIDFYEGKENAEIDILKSVALRSGLIAAGLFAAGFRNLQLVKGAVFGAVAIEIWVLLETKQEMDKTK